jgi:hypothetical protein
LNLGSQGENILHEKPAVVTVNIFNEKAFDRNNYSNKSDIPGELNSKLIHTSSTQDMFVKTPLLKRDTTFTSGFSASNSNMNCFSVTKKLGVSTGNISGEFK